METETRTTTRVCPKCKGTGMWMQQLAGTVGRALDDYDERECGTCAGTGGVA